MRTKTEYIAHDGKVFATESECRAHEEMIWRKVLLRIKAEDLDDALSLRNPILAAAFERVGRMCGDARRAAGGYKFRRGKYRSQTGEASAAEPQAAGDRTGVQLAADPHCNLKDLPL